MITDNQTNKIYFAPNLGDVCPKLWASIHEALTTRNIRHGMLRYPNYIWCRDYMPIQIADDNFVTYHFRPDYLTNNRRYHKYLCCDGYMLCAELGYGMTGMDLVIDGGNVVKCGDAIVMTEKVFAENQTKNRAEVESILRDKFKCDIIFLPWDKDEIYGHSDGIVHYAGEGRVLMTNYEDFEPKIAREMTMRLERRFEVIHLKYKSKRKHMRSWAYINFLQTEQLIMVPQLGIEEDEQALEQIGSLFSDCETIGIPALEAVRRGGALNCISWNVKDNGTVPARLHDYMTNTKMAFVQYGADFLSDAVFIPLQRFVNNPICRPSHAELSALQNWIKEKKEYMKNLSKRIHYGCPHFSDKDNRMWSELKTWKLILSILSPCVESLEETFRFPPFEFIAE